MDNQDELKRFSLFNNKLHLMQDNLNKLFMSFQKNMVIELRGKQYPGQIVDLRLVKMKYYKGVTFSLYSDPKVKKAPKSDDEQLYPSMLNDFKGVKLRLEKLICREHFALVKGCRQLKMLMLSECIFDSRKQLQQFILDVSLNCRILESLILFKCQLREQVSNDEGILLGNLKFYNLKTLSILNDN